MGPMGLNPPNIYVTSILVRSVQVLCTIGVITADRVAKKAKNEGKLPFYGYFLAIWVGLWRRDSNHSNIYWHPWFGPILSTFGCLEVSFAENSHLSLTRCFRGTSSFAITLCTICSCTSSFGRHSKLQNVSTLTSQWKWKYGNLSAPLHLLDSTLPLPLLKCQI